MEFNEKLQELRRRRGLTQEELAQSLFVSRTAVSKWEAGRGYPNIDSLRQIAKFFSVTVDELLSGEELLSVADEDARRKETRIRDLVSGLLDCSMGMLLFLPLFGQTDGGTVKSVSLLSLEFPGYLLIAFFALVICTVLTGIIALALQNFTHPVWEKIKTVLTLLLSTAGVLLFILSRQPYAAAFTFVFLVIKAWMLIKKR